ncbi:MAG: hypothetical protein ACI86C_000807 [Candidatus Latescibacterota bacterium]|jgi:hypothetical protein
MIKLHLKTILRFFTFSSLLLGLFFVFESCNETANSDDKKPNIPEKPAIEEATKGLFQKVPTSHSTIDFSNNLTENLATIENLFDFDYFYNGAGVGVADLNNDGLQDIFFAGNQVANKLYLNKGDLVFEDISESAQINSGKQWANGVTFVDINNDGFIDIYVSQGGPRKANLRKNLFYINNGDLTFTESAENMGLADRSISTQSVFFDYDHDGDLDCFVSNENEFYGLDPASFYNQMKSAKVNLERSSGHLYQNNAGRFTDVSESAGVLSASFGLGVIVSDINNDGWEDIYVANDYYVPDSMFINNKDGSFSNDIKTHTNQISFYGMGVDIADVNNDNLQDIFVLDMAASDHIRSKTLMASMDVERFSLLVDTFDMPYQYMFNSLQVNAGNNIFRNVAHQAKIAKTDWSWAGLMVDFDYDGLKDIYVTNGYRRYALDNDSQRQVAQMQQAYRGNVPLEIKRRLYDALPSEKLSNILFENNEDFHFKDNTKHWGLSEPSFSNGATYADLDNDGDLDLVVNNIDETAFLYKNTTSERKLANYLRVTTKGVQSEAFAKVTVTQNGASQFIENKRVKGYLSAAQQDAFFGLGTVDKVDAVTVLWPSGKMEERLNVDANTHLIFEEKNAINVENIKAKAKPFFAKAKSIYGLDFNHNENSYNDFSDEILLPYKQSTLGPSMAKGDVNSDGLEDVFIGGASGQAGKLFVQTAAGFSLKPNNGFELDKASEDMEALFFDADGDGDQDLYVVSGGNEFDAGASEYSDRLYINNGSGKFEKKNDAGINSITESGKTIACFDFDKDGDLDLVVGNRIVPQHYPKVAPSFVLRNDAGSFTNVTHEVAPDFSKLGIVNKIIATDFNNDGWEDLIAVGEWTGIAMLKNEEGVFRDVSEKSKLDAHKGLWFTVAETDVNADGLKDYIVGNVGENIKFKATQEIPFKIFGNDFDDNGTYDIVLSTEYKGVSVPARGRQCTSQQMPFVAEKFETFNAFAKASLTEIYGDKLLTADQGEITSLQSVILLNKGDDTFEIEALPAEAQAFPLLSIASSDLDEDGVAELILVGNIYNTEVETPRLDMGSGLVLRNDNGVLRAMSYDEAGLFIEGNTKKIVTIKHNGLQKELLLCAKNNDALGVFEVQR